MTWENYFKHLMPTDMKTSNLIIIIFIGSFFLITAVGFTVGKFYPPEYNINISENKESYDLDEFSVIVIKGVDINISMGDNNRFSYYHGEIASDKESEDLSIPKVEVRNDTCFISSSNTGRRVSSKLYTTSLRSMILEEKSKINVDNGIFDSLSIKSYSSNIYFNNSVVTQSLTMETIGKSTHHLGTIRNLNINSDGAKVQVIGSNLVEGKITNGSQFYLNKSQPKLDLDIDSTSKIFIQ